MAVGVRDKVRALPLVGRDDADLGRVGAGAEELCDDLLDVGCLCAVEVGRARRRDLLGPDGHVEEHGLGGHRPREVETCLLSLLHGHTVLQSALVEGVGGELGETRVHAVLHLQPDGTHTQCNETLKQTLAETGPRGLLAHDDGSELAVVAHEHTLLGPEHDGDEALWLCGLGALVDEHLCESEVGEARVAGPDACGADDVGSHEDLSLCGAFEGLVLLLVSRRQLPELVLELLQLGQIALFCGVQVAHAVVEGEVLHGRRHALSALGTQPHDLEARGVDLLRQLVHRHVGRRAHQHLPMRHAAQMQHDAR
mmetsp:Transcript_6255/g.15425  ORF Transcript_6255/g.15425 Transcript_6255/m.15425 type:complete len:311 (-) Transcript_6255:812-1744(-)